MDFYDLDLNDDVLDALDDMNFVETTPIQEKAIPAILDGRDLIAVAQTGTGKTAAYLLPVLSMLSDGGYPQDAINCIIMSPTRELAQQIDQAMQGFAYYLPDVSSVAVYGGNDGIRYEQEKRGFEHGASIIIATPGRLISHISLGNIDLSRVSFFILDEADRMLDMGFSEDIMQIERNLPKNRQTIMFSATMPEKISELAKTILTNPVEIKLAVSKPADKIRQQACICYEAQKINFLKSLFTKRKPQRVIIFAGSKLKVKDLAISLKRAGYVVGAMHSDLQQSERDDVMYAFKSNKIDILVATDIVARGIDIDDIQLVINFDVPHDAEDYVHRIGRTARAGADGAAITLVSDKDMPNFQKIEHFLGKEIERLALPEELGEAPSYNKGGRGRRGNGKSNGRHDQRRRKDSGKKPVAKQPKTNNETKSTPAEGEAKRRKSHGRRRPNTRKPNTEAKKDSEKTPQN